MTSPEHLEPVTNQENTRRGAVQITHCPAGHVYDEENTITRTRTRVTRVGTVYVSNERSCKACRRDRRAKTVEEKKRSSHV